MLLNIYHMATNRDLSFTSSPEPIKKEEEEDKPTKRSLEEILTLFQSKKGDKTDPAGYQQMIGDIQYVIYHFDDTSDSHRNAILEYYPGWELVDFEHLMVRLNEQYEKKAKRSTDMERNEHGHEIVKALATKRRDVRRLQEKLDLLKRPNIEFFDTLPLEEQLEHLQANLRGRQNMYVTNYTAHPKWHRFLEFIPGTEANQRKKRFEDGIKKTQQQIIVLQEQINASSRQQRDEARRIKEQDKEKKIAELEEQIKIIHQEIAALQNKLR